jgi:hypothetical protein
MLAIQSTRKSSEFQLTQIIDNSGEVSILWSVDLLGASDLVSGMTSDEVNGAIM